MLKILKILEYGRRKIFSNQILLRKIEIILTFSVPPEPTPPRIPTPPPKIDPRK